MSMYINDAGQDLRATAQRIIPPYGRGLVPTDRDGGVPEGYVGLVCPRSGLALNAGVTVLNAPGVIDSGYEGNVGVILYNTTDEPYFVKPGDRVAQLVTLPVLGVSGTLTERGSNGFGSSGV